MIDFSFCEIDPFRAYGGGNGNKIGIVYRGKTYMLKFPPADKKRGAYTNSCISEHLGCLIFASTGLFDVQETLYGTYTAHGKEKEVVACRDFTGDGFALMEFAKVKNAHITGAIEGSPGYSTELDEVLEAIDTQHLVDPIEVRRFFWNMFIMDAYLGNFDRHNGNWGFLVNETERTAKLAPIYDCGSCLYPQLPTEKMNGILEDPNEIEHRIYVFPNAALKIHGQKINYHNFIAENTYEECTAALKRVLPRIEQDKIDALISSCDFLSPTQKKFYITMLRARREKILHAALSIVEPRVLLQG